MPQVAGAIAAVSGWLAGSGLGAVVGRLLISTAVSAISAAVQKQLSKPSPPGIKTDYTTDGGTRPMSFVMGWYATDGHHVCPPMSHGRVGRASNAYLTYVIALADVPGMQIDKVIIDDTEVEFEAAPQTILQGGTVPTDRPAWWYEQQGISPAEPNAPTPERPQITPGQPVMGDKYRGKIWLRYHDGSQTAPDPYLMQVYGPGTAWASSSERPWTADMVGAGTCYAALTFKHDTRAFNGLPRVRFVMRGIPLYDPRKDSSAGGTGPQRWNDRTTWAASTNGMVLAYNVLRGIPIEGGPLWGYGVAAAGLPLAAWAPTMNAADQIIDGNPRWQASWEVSVDEQPATVLDEILKVCCAEVAESGGVWKPRIGPDGAPVHVLTDDDLILDKDASAAPFPGLEATYNGVHASYPEPKALWRPKDAPPRYNAGWEAADQGRRLVAELNLPACPWDGQIQRVMRAYIEEERRFRRHVVPLPPEAEALEVFDVVAWTSSEHGYDAKLFRVVEVGEDPETLLITVSLREVDPADYDWRPDFRLPSTVPSVIRPSPDPIMPQSFTAEGVALEDGAGRPRRAAARLRWGGWSLDGVTALCWELRRTGQTEAARGLMGDPEAGETLVTAGILPGTDYQARISFLADGERAVGWTVWTAFTTPDIRLTADDFDTTAPDTPPPPTLTSTLTSLTASWAAEGAAVAYSELEYTENGGNPVFAQTGGNRHTVNGTLPGTLFSVRRRRVDRVGNKSNWSLPATHTTAKDTVPPAAPTGLSVVGTFGAFVVKWNRNTETDLAYYELAMAAAANPTAIISSTAATTGMVGGQADNLTRHFRVRAVDTSGNRSSWSANVSATTLGAALTTITTEQLQGLIDNTSFAAGVQPIRIWPDAALPTTYQVDLIAWQGALYRWSGTGYVKDVLAQGAVQTAHLDAGVVTTQKMAVGFGGNFITNSDFKTGTTGWMIAKSGVAGTATDLIRQPPGAWAGFDYPTLALRQNSADSTGYADARFLGIKDSTGAVGSGWPVKTDDWIEVSLQTSVHRCNCELRIQWLAEDGSVVAHSAATALPNNSGSSTNPDIWPRTWMKAIAPANAAYAVIHIRKLGTTSGANSYLFIHKPMMTHSSSERTEPTAYAPGTFTLVDGAGLLTDSVTARAVNTTDLAVNGLAHLNVAYIKEANITGTLSAAILRAGTALASTLTVDGTALATVQSRASDPAARINAHTTQIDPGKIIVSGTTTLADWRKGGDLTKIDGGQLATNSVAANKASIGMRGVQPIGIEFEHNKPGVNRAAWTAGTIEYVADDGSTATASVSAGQTTTWSSGVQYICWVKGATALTVTTSQSIAIADNRVILATYEGGHRLNASYGRTIIDGNSVKTDALLVTNNAQMGALTVRHFNINGFAIAHLKKKTQAKWRVAANNFTDILKLTVNPAAGNWTTGWTPLITTEVARLAGYETELLALLDHAGAGANIFSNPNTSLLQTRWQRKRSNQTESGWVDLNLMHSQSGEAGARITNILSFTDPAPAAADSGFFTQYRLVGRKTNDTRMQKMSPYVYNVRLTLTHYKQR